MIKYFKKVYGFSLSNKESRNMVLIGTIVAGCIPLLYHMFKSVFQTNLSIFTFGFLIVGGVLGYYYSEYQKRNLCYKDKVLITTLFSLLGVGISCLLYMRYDTKFPISEIPIYFIIVSFAVSMFVYIFWITFYSVKNKGFIWKTSYITFLILSFFILIFIEKNNISTILTLGVPILIVNFCVALVVIFMSTIYFYMDYFKNIIINIIILLITVVLTYSSAIVYYSIVKDKGVVSWTFVWIFVLLILLINIFHFINIGELKSSSNTNLKKRFRTSFEWLSSIPILLMNYSIGFAFAALIPYIGMTKRFRSTHWSLNGEPHTPLKSIEVKKSLILSITSFFMYFIFIVFYDLKVNFIFYHVFIWALVGFISTVAIAYNLHFHEE